MEGERVQYGSRRTGGGVAFFCPGCSLITRVVVDGTASTLLELIIMEIPVDSDRALAGQAPRGGPLTSTSASESRLTDQVLEYPLLHRTV